MRHLNNILLFIGLGFTACTSKTLNVQDGHSGYSIDQVPFTDVNIYEDSFWGQRIKAARDVMIPLAFSKCESEGRIENFVKAAHPSSEYDVSSFMGFPFDDTDVYKTIEGASYVLQTYPDKKLEKYIDSIIDIIAAAQEPDGYLFTAMTINPEKPQQWVGKERWAEEENLSHELYNLGHLVDAACAHYQATGSEKLLNIARRFADCTVREIGQKEGQTCVVPGHQIAEMALARLYVLTGERKYLDEAKFFLDMRGKTGIRNHMTQSHLPVIDQEEAVGHAVRAGYMYAGMADVAALTGDSTYIRAIDRLWNNIVSKKYYITGGVGALHDGEAFGADYELPNLTAYNETCAAIAQVYFNQRMFLLHGDSKYIDCLERTLYNGVISGMSLGGDKFFYPNPLACDGEYHFNSDNTIERQPWFGCACCPSNLCRFIPSVPGYVYAVKDNALYVNLFMGSTSTVGIEGKEVVLEQITHYPWDGDIELRIKKNKAGTFAMKIRIPGWVQGSPVPSDLYAYSDSVSLGYSISVNGETVSDVNENGYFTLERRWSKGDRIRIHFDMEPRLVSANEKVADDRGMLAIERGPLVYCAEQVDNPSFDLQRFFLDKKPILDTSEAMIPLNSSYHRMVAVTATGAILPADGGSGTADAEAVSIKLIPYYAWNHRGVNKMQVWLPGSLDFFDLQ